MLKSIINKPGVLLVLITIFLFSGCACNKTWKEGAIKGALIGAAVGGGGGAIGDGGRGLAIGVAAGAIVGGTIGALIYRCEGEEVIENADSDGDGVVDRLDQCPDTPCEAKVNFRGCWILKGVYFETAKWSIKPESYPALDEVVNILKRNPNLKVEIQGYTDNAGKAQDNKILSEKRAISVMEYLVKKGIHSGQLTYKGYGPQRPIATNETPEGRSKNRRVELKPIR